MQNRTWNINLAATDDHPATTLEGVSQRDALEIVQALMYGAPTRAHEQVEALRAEREPIAA